MDSFEDEDGCPDHASIRIVENRIVIMEHVFFVKSSSRLQEVEVQGHSTPRACADLCTL